MDSLDVKAWRLALREGGAKAWREVGADSARRRACDFMLYGVVLVWRGSL